MSSFLKYNEDEEIRQGNGRGPVSFRRAHLDGMPYRGESAMLREEEYDELTETVRDGYVQLFDLSDASDHQRLQEIVDCAANGWYAIHKMTEQFVAQADGSVKVYIYCVWVEPHKELAKHRIPVTMALSSQGQPQ